MRPIQTFHVRPSLPDRLRPLESLAYNLRWSWDHETITLFRRLDRDLWEESGHNPVQMLGTISQQRLAEASADEAFLAHMDRVGKDLDDYMAGATTWCRKSFGPGGAPEVAYFCMEFGLTDCLPIYSGGLGILAGDHLKSASDLGIPLVGVGLLYQKGYFRQYLSAEGWQQERYPVNEFSTLPLRPFHDRRGEPVRISIDLAGRTVLVRPWRAQVGRVTLVLLDTNIAENPPDLQDVTDELYGGSEETRLRQEIVLGIGGVRALEALGLTPRVYHMNEGHCAFLSLERIRRLTADGRLSFHEALELISAGGVFTTHTPVPAGIDVFAPDLMERYFASYRSQLGLAREEILDLGRIHPGDPSEPFNMAVLAIRTSSSVNGVSRLHGRVSRNLWREIWPEVPVPELPIGHITNGVHAQSWISDDMRYLYDRYLGPRWAEEPGDTRAWKRAEQIPGEELWRTHERRRERMVTFARRRLVDQLRRRGAGRAEIDLAAEALDPSALTIGFARRFATYKRGTLLFSDPERLDRIVNAAGRPVQIIIAGKAHPQDEAGKTMIRQIIQIARRPEFRSRIVFLEDYDTVIARYMVQGVDVWLNNPRRPLEASGTSGMKAAFNGALNLSILDGWWDEACSERTGWAIGRGEDYQDHDYQDRVEAGILYERLEREVVPLYYDRGRDDLPRGWIALMKSAIGELCPRFNANRMVHEYTLQAYCPSGERLDALEQDDHRRARALAAWRSRVRQHWKGIRLTRIEADLPSEVRVGARLEVRAWVDPGPLTAADLRVEIYEGRIDPDQEIVGAKSLPMAPQGDPTRDGILFSAQLPCEASGTHGFTVRVLPSHVDLGRAHDTGLILWASPGQLAAGRERSTESPAASPGTPAMKG